MDLLIYRTNLTLIAPITTAADDILKKNYCFSEKIRLDVSSESSARQRIHLKNQALFSSKDQSKKLKCCLVQFLCGALRVKVDGYTFRGGNSVIFFLRCFPIMIICSVW